MIYTSQSEVYLHLPGVIVTQKATEVRYLLSDGLGSIRHAVDETATIVAYHEFDPYGNPVAGERWEVELIWSSYGRGIITPLLTPSFVYATKQLIGFRFYSGASFLPLDFQNQA